MAKDAKEAVRNASALVAQAITELTEIGPEAPSTVREALASLSSTFVVLGWTDPAVSYGISRDASHGPPA